ncbi:hypothetical protein [Aeromonas jandaei]|uniref:hypothetical protein n=1 Tax=Aeromonas jandaei TaxID=650 RepID=UPI003BA15CF7
MEKITKSSLFNKDAKNHHGKYETIGEFNNDKVSYLGGDEGECYGATMQFAKQSICDNENRPANFMVVDCGNASIIETKQAMLHQPHEMIEYSIGLQSEMLLEKDTVGNAFGVLKQAYKNNETGVFQLNLYGMSGGDITAHSVAYHFASDASHTVTFFDPNRDIRKIIGDPIEVMKGTEKRLSKEYDMGCLYKITESSSAHVPPFIHDTHISNRYQDDIKLVQPGGSINLNEPNQNIGNDKL